MFDEYFNPPSIDVSPVQEAAATRAMVLADSPVSTSIDQDAPSISTPSTQEQEQSPNISQGFEESPKTPIFHDDPLNESPHEESTSQGSSSNVRQTHTLFEHLEDSCFDLEEQRGNKDISLDDLYNNLKIYEPEVTGSSSISQNPQNVAFVSSNSTNNNSITNEADNTAYGVKSQVSDKFKTGLGYNPASSTAASPIVESFVNSSEMLENQEYNKSKSNKGYHAVPLPYIGNYIPSKPNLMFMDEIFKSKNVDVITVITPSDVKKVETNHESTALKNKDDAVEPKTVRKNRFRSPIIDDWNSDDDSEVEFIPNVKTVRPSTKKINFVKHARETVEKMIGNKFYLTEYEDYDGRFVSFRDGKGRILVLSFDFKLLDESQVLLRVPRKDNIYSVDLKSVVPTKGLTCLFAKATIDESNLWHMRLGHINFKNMN
ncbi:putative ribonuclease H-like domain-containing protein [Tanacetum coccineum]